MPKWAFNSTIQSVFTCVGTYVQRGSKFCFVVLVGVTDIAQNTALLSNFTMLSAYCTIACTFARQPCPAALPGSLARQPCPAALPSSLARQPCPADSPVRLTKFSFRPNIISCVPNYCLNQLDVNKQSLIRTDCSIVTVAYRFYVRTFHRLHLLRQFWTPTILILI
jgi:hypothetical protein